MTRKRKKDRLKAFLTPMLSRFVFMSLQPSLTEKWGISKEMAEVKFPFEAEDIKALELGGLSAVKLAENIAFLLGCDPQFNFARIYETFLHKIFGENLIKGLEARALKSVEKEDPLEAIAFLRCANKLESLSLSTTYNYGLLCRNIYEKPEMLSKYNLDNIKAKIKRDEEAFETVIIGFFKAEAMETFEDISVKWPDFYMAHYFLGYDYLNMGLYNKSNLSFKKFMELSEQKNEGENSATDSKELSKYRFEIGELIEYLIDPCKIEDGCNEVIRGRFKEGLKILELYEENEIYSKWWPMYFYLGTTRKELGLWEAAVATLKRVLKLNPVHKESMELLVDLYYTKGDQENLIKYRKKLELL